MIDNFELIDPLFYFNEANDMFFFCQLIVRGKDHKDEKVPLKIIKTYFVTSRDHLKALKDEIVLLCEHHGARAYINVAGKDFGMVQKNMLYRLAEYNLSDTVVHPFRILNKIASECKSRSPRWVVDIDDITLEDKIRSWLIKYFGDKYHIWSTIPTVHGVHLITSPFNLQEFNQVFPDVDVHKNAAGTLLYFPNSIQI